MNEAFARSRRARISMLLCFTCSTFGGTALCINFVTLVRRTPMRYMMTTRGMSTQSRIAGSSCEGETTSVRVSARADATVRVMCWHSVGG